MIIAIVGSGHWWYSKLERVTNEKESWRDVVGDGGVFTFRKLVICLFMTVFAITYA